LPPGYCLFYGFNKQGRFDYIVKTVNLLKAEGSKEWVSVDELTEAREKDGLEIKRVKKRKKDHSDMAKLLEHEWKTVKKYAMPLKRAEKVSKLWEELNDYGYETIRKLSDKFDVWYGKLPTIVIDIEKGGHYKKESNKIVLKTLAPEEIHKLAGHFLYEHHNPKKKGASLLNRFFRLVIREAVGFYCAKFGNVCYGVKNVKERLYSKKSAKKKDNAMVKKIMRANLGLAQTSKPCDGLIKNKLIEKLQSYISKGANFETLAQNLGAVFGNRLWEQGSEYTIGQLLIEHKNYFEDFFNIKSFLSPLEKMYTATHEDMRKRILEEKKK